MKPRLHLPGDHPGDWPEDFPHENGCYMNRCCGCGLIFHGHKRRVQCKVCAGLPLPSEGEMRKEMEE